MGMLVKPTGEHEGMGSQGKEPGKRDVMDFTKRIEMAVVKS